MSDGYDVEGIADGRLENGAFVRTFWFWYETDQGEMHVRARIQGSDYAGDVPLATVQRRVDESGPDVTFPIGEHLVTMPTDYLDGILLAIHHQLQEIGKGRPDGAEH